jgi:hypothetical protein
MARNVIERELTAVHRGRFEFAIAAREDDAEIRRLLRDNPMSGTISLSFEREPDYFADSRNPFESKETIVASEEGRLICMGYCTVRERFINGEAARVGYLGGLRLAASHAGQIDIVRAGYEFFHQLQVEAPAEFYFTSIASDNHRARRLLERGLPGMPSYEFIGEMVTLLLPVRRARGDATLKAMSTLTGRHLSERLNRYNSHYQLAPVWSAEELESLFSMGLQPQNFFENGTTSAALWDQSLFKQTVVRGYAAPLAKSRWLVNAAARFTGDIRLPDVGERLRNVYVSHLTSEAWDDGALIELLMNLRNIAARDGFEMLTLAFADNDPQLSTVRRAFRSHEYRTRIYLVRWPDCGSAASCLDKRIMAPEVALL